MWRNETEAPADDHFDNEVIRAVRDSDSESEVEFPVRAEIIIEAGKKLLLLKIEGVEAGDGAI